MAGALARPERDYETEMRQQYLRRPGLEPGPALLFRLTPDGLIPSATSNAGSYGSLLSRGRRKLSPQLSAFSFSAACGAKYVKMPSAPARLNPTRLSIIARSPSIQPWPAAAAIIAYSPET